jgi:hypothetical protein
VSDDDDDDDDEESDDDDDDDDEESDDDDDIEEVNNLAYDIVELVQNEVNVDNNEDESDDDKDNEKVNNLAYNIVEPVQNEVNVDNKKQSSSSTLQQPSPRASSSFKFPSVSLEPPTLIDIMSRPENNVAYSIWLGSNHNDSQLDVESAMDNINEYNSAIKILIDNNHHLSKYFAESWVGNYQTFRQLAQTLPDEAMVNLGFFLAWPPSHTIDQRKLKMSRILYDLNCASIKIVWETVGVDNIIVAADQVSIRPKGTNKTIIKYSYLFFS